MSQPVRIMPCLDMQNGRVVKGVACMLPTSKATDGVRTGFDLPLIRMIAESTSADVVASGGAGELAHFVDAAKAGAAVLLAASVFHFGLIAIPDLKAHLRKHGIPVAGTLAAG